MKTILVVAYHYPPENGSCSEKNVRIVKKILEAGFNVRVITGNFQTHIENDKNLIVFHTKSGRFHKDITACNNDATGVNAAKSAEIKQKVKQILSGAAIPDATMDWIPEVRKFIRSHPEVIEGIDLVYSISSPYTAHILSREISRMAKVPYIMCYGDPWLYEPKRKRGPLRYQIEKKLEGDLIREAAGVSLITDWNRKEYMRLYSIPEDKINTYLIGYEDDNVEFIPSAPRKDGVFTMLYGGSLDPVHRNAEPFIRAMTKLTGTYTEIRNNDFPAIKDLVEKNGVSDKVIVKPLIPSSEFEKLQYSFDALILFGNKTPFQIPGKVFTYISTGKTIIYIKNNTFEDDGTEMVLRQYGNTIIVQNDEDSIVQSLRKYISEGEGTKEFNSAQFSYRNTMEPLITMINRILNNR